MARDEPVSSGNGHEPRPRAVGQYESCTVLAILILAISSRLQAVLNWPLITISQPYVYHEYRTRGLSFDTTAQTPIQVYSRQLHYRKAVGKRVK